MQGRMHISIIENCISFMGFKLLMLEVELTALLCLIIHLGNRRKTKLYLHFV